MLSLSHTYDWLKLATHLHRHISSLIRSDIRQEKLRRLPLHHRLSSVHGVRPSQQPHPVSLAFRALGSICWSLEWSASYDSAWHLRMLTYKYEDPWEAVRWRFVVYASRRIRSVSSVRHRYITDLQRIYISAGFPFAYITVN